MNDSRESKNQKICAMLHAKDEKGMELLFNTYYKVLVVWADVFLRDMNMAEDVVQHLESAAKKKNITVSLDGSPVMVNGVRNVIYEMLFNIADNAIRYTDLKGTVKISLGMRGEHPYYCVEDNGIGIAEDEQKRIFERFYRVDKSHSRATGGTGLGLSIVKHGAILHNAQINLESEPGKGTKMELVF